MMPNQLSEQERLAGWRLLFDGRSLDGWSATGQPEGWIVQDESIYCTGQRGGYLYTREQFENFTLDLEFKIEPGCNSGIFVRWSDLTDPVNTGIEIQVFDSYAAKELNRHTCGAIYDLVAPSAHVFKPAGEWNSVRIDCDGPNMAVTLNGTQIATIDISRYTEAGRGPDGSKNKFKYAWAGMPRLGHIGLQDHGGSHVWYRNVKLRPR